MNICIGFSKSRMLFSYLVSWFENTPYSHTYVEYADFDGTTKVFHSTFLKGTHVETLEEFLKTRTPLEKFNVPLTVDPDRFYGYIDGAKGKRYSMLQILNMAFIRWLGMDIFRNGGAFQVCSESTGEVLRNYCGVELKGRSDTWKPVDIYNAIRGMNGNVE